MEEYAQEVIQYGSFKAKVTVKEEEISLYHYNGKHIEIRFNYLLNKIVSIETINDKLINPYVKYLTLLSLN